MRQQFASRLVASAFAIAAPAANASSWHLLWEVYNEEAFYFLTLSRSKRCERSRPYG